MRNSQLKFNQSWIIDQVRCNINQIFEFFTISNFAEKNTKQYKKRTNKYLNDISVMEL